MRNDLNTLVQNYDGTKIYKVWLSKRTEVELNIIRDSQIFNTYKRIAELSNLTPSYVSNRIKKLTRDLQFYIRTEAKRLMEYNLTKLSEKHKFDTIEMTQYCVVFHKSKFIIRYNYYSKTFDIKCKGQTKRNRIFEEIILNMSFIANLNKIVKEGIKDDYKN